MHKGPFKIPDSLSVRPDEQLEFSRFVFGIATKSTSIRIVSTAKRKKRIFLAEFSYHNISSCMLQKFENLVAASVHHKENGTWKRFAA